MRLAHLTAAVLAILGGLQGGFQRYLEAAELIVSDRITNRILAYPYDLVTGLTTGGAARELVANDPELAEPTALAIGAGNDLFVASRSTGRVHRYDLVTGAPIGVNGVFIEPTDPNLGGAAGLAYDGANNRLYVSKFGSPLALSLIQTYDATSGAHLPAEDIVAGRPGWRTGLAIDTGGNLYVNSFSNEGFTGGGESGAVLRFAAGNFAAAPTELLAGDGIPLNSIDSAGQGIYIDGLNGLALGDGGDVYAASLFGQEVLKLNGNNPPPVSVIGSSPFDFPVLGDLPPYLVYPSGVLIDGDGNLLVSTLGNDRVAGAGDPIYGTNRIFGNIQKFAPDGVFLGIVPTPLDALNLSPAINSFQPTSMLISPVPEPSTLALIGWAAGACAGRRFRKHRSIYRS